MVLSEGLIVRAHFKKGERIAVWNQGLGQYLYSDGLGTIIYKEFGSDVELAADPKNVVTADFIIGQGLQNGDGSVIGLFDFLTADGEVVIRISRSETINYSPFEVKPFESLTDWNSFQNPCICQTKRMQILVRDLRTLCYSIVWWDNNWLTEENGRQYLWEHNPYSHWKVIR